MSRFRLVFSALLLLAVSFSVVAFANNSKTTLINNEDLDVSGTWNVDADAEGQQVELTFDLKQAEKAFDGTVSTPFGDGTVENGKVDEANITATINIEIQGQAMTLALKAKVEDGKMTGTMDGEGAPEVTFVGTKKDS